MIETKPKPSAMAARRPSATSAQRIVRVAYTSDASNDARRRAAQLRREREYARRLASLTPSAGWFCCADCDLSLEQLDWVESALA